MNIMVFDVPAASGGALSVLREYYNMATRDPDKTKTWYFVVGLPELHETDNVKVLRFPWVKKSWFHRLYFDQWVSPKIVDRYKADQVLSLQNVIIPRVEAYQILYVHQPLPFADRKFRLYENWLFWLYQNIVGRLIVKSIQEADKVIVQTNWMKQACVIRAKVEPGRIEVVPPGTDIEVKRHFELTEQSLRTFFYPASGMLYKNHSLIVDASSLLRAQGVNDYTVIFTLKGDENRHVRDIYRRVQVYDLPIEFAGPIPREQVFQYYSKSVLLFPSYIETFGLPLLEARLHKCPVLASDCLFSREILDGYEKVWFFDPNNAKLLAKLMMRLLEQLKADPRQVAGAPLRSDFAHEMY